MGAFLSDTRTWVFDLDNTLYPPKVRLFDQIEAKMVDFVMDHLNVDRAKANHLRRIYWERHGTTLAGLMDEHGMDPELFLIAVHDIDFTVLPPDPVLRDLITALPGRKIIYTNGTAPYAENVTGARGLGGIFDAIYGVEHAGFRPKPERAAFEAVFGLDGFDLATAAMFEDEARNLEVPKAMGLATVHVAPTANAAPYIDHHCVDLTDVLTQVADTGAKIAMSGV
ncbi:MAG: pyrimidine 5'-nucleotidase [Pseudomonadota bacterium]